MDGTTSNQNKNYTGNDGRSSTFGRGLAAFIQNKLPYANIIDTDNNQLIFYFRFLKSSFR